MALSSYDKTLLCITGSVAITLFAIAHSCSSNHNSTSNVTQAPAQSQPPSQASAPSPLKKPPSEPVKPYTYTVDSVSACQDFVKTTIKAPSWFTRVQLNWQFNEKTWIVIGHLDYGFGTPVRGEY